LRAGADMGPKLLFIVGIVVAHGALAAGWVRQEPPKQRISAATCVRTPDALPYIAPRRELFARADIAIIDLRVSRP
jgi:hypothetical protein